MAPTAAEEDILSRGAIANRRKGTVNRNRLVLVVSETGMARQEEMGKHSIMRRTGLPARDLRALDPLLSYPSSILGRERSIIINLEQIRAIITATEMLLLNFSEPVMDPFINDLRERVAAFPLCEKEMNEDTSAKLNVVAGQENGTHTEHLAEDMSVSLALQSNKGERNNLLHSSDSPKHRELKVLPFEFRVLEVCLESTCRNLESETLILEDEAYPALDKLTSKTSTLNLEHVRKIKSRLVSISGRVQKVRDELEHLLDDDMDMAEMYLTEKLIYKPAKETSNANDLDTNTFDVGEERDKGPEKNSENASESSEGFKPNIEELEMLLEAYFMQIDGTLNKLSMLRDYVDDTEDYINIMLDEKQNQLLHMGVMFSTANLVCSAGIVVVSIFGMNIATELSVDTIRGNNIFSEVTVGIIVGCVILYFLAILWGKRSGVLQF